MSGLLRFALDAVSGHRLRTFLSTLGVAIGIGSVILLTSIGEGTRQYMLDQFTQFGTNLLAINPGKAQTMGIPGIMGGTTHKLTLDDARALERISGVVKVMPLAFATARVEGNGRGRSVFVYGVTSDVPEVWQFRARQGSFWPAGEPRQTRALTVVGPKLKRELFGDANALGRFVRIGGMRFRVVGIMEPKGQFLGFDIDDAAYIPVGTAMNLFNLDEVNEIDVLFSHASLLDGVVAGITRLLTDRHDGNEDFTITSQAAMLETSDNIMGIITMAVGAIAAISLLVGAVGILTMTWISVGERTSEIGVLRAIGASRWQVQFVFLAEAAVLATAGGVVGLAGGVGLAALLRFLVPGLPVRTPVEFVVAALLVSVVTGLLSGLLPARRAASLDPIEALRVE